MEEIKQTKRATEVLRRAFDCAQSHRHEFIMPEHLLWALLDEISFKAAACMFCDSERLLMGVEDFFEDVECVPESIDYHPELSKQMSDVIGKAVDAVVRSNAEEVDVTHLTQGLLQLPESWACYLLKEALDGKEANFMSRMVEFCDKISDKMQTLGEEGLERASWKNLVSCMNDCYGDHNPLIGRERELARTVQVLCRLEKNNPLHIGEPGVGKTALVWGLVGLIEEGRVPKRLKGSRIYQLDMGTLLAGTAYRGEMESRIKDIMDGIASEGDNNIVYIDEIHTLVGAGAVGEGSMDASNMLKPYLDAGKIRFIGATTYAEFNRYFSRSKGLIRRFQQIPIEEPSAEATKNIIMQLLPRYEEFHGVKYSQEAVGFAVDAAAKHIHDRFLPDKAIDLIDEAGAAMQVKNSTSVIDKEAIADVLAKTCKVDALAEARDDDYRHLESLPARMLGQIYGQDEAIRQVVEAVQMSRAGLLDDNKPLASLLFVGPTGVGKTEVAVVLAKELGLNLVRFDMSEYTEKHAVAKLIGSPAGYVGYEDGGLLTDAIRKTPNCVLLLDEIEKAHQDIYNILLQVMDYARLTDNKGRQADFRNVVLIMTSNAGAQYASQASVGFKSTTSRGEAMMRQVKKTFKPEFLNRLSSAVVFRDMDREMAVLILRKKLRQLHGKLAKKQVTLSLSDEAFELLLKEGFTAEYGAREMDRVISQRLKPLLMREILFGSLRNGGNLKIGVENGSLSIG